MTTNPDDALDEATLIRRFFADRVRPRPDVAVGIGDDGALTTPPPGRSLVTVTDMLVEGSHFLPGIPPAALGHRALAVNLSDLAAMGAEPLWCTLALSLPEARAGWLAEFARGFLDLADRAGITLIGGDTVRGPLAVNVTALGAVEPGRTVLRRGARPGDQVWVSGTPGDAVAGRLLLAKPAADPPDRREEAAWLQQRFLHPEPRLALGRHLAGLATAMLDVSDGLHDDLCKLAAASGVALVLDADRLPLSAALRVVAPEQALEYALTGGDDYELAFTLPPGAAPAMVAWAADAGLAVTAIGEVRAGTGVEWNLAGRPLVVPDSTYRHF